jgi:hypothetical protein
MSDLPPELARMPSWADSTPPLPGAWCRACEATRWWTERHEPQGWRCGACHPPDHLKARAGAPGGTGAGRAAAVIT